MEFMSIGKMKPFDNYNIRSISRKNKRRKESYRKRMGNLLTSRITLIQFLDF
jgi:hypothetical protein